ncbi:hypothetical protein [Bacillus sp. WP8]|uniref:hypothetical protein n=1 Tax=Bacillus sp. WP8 TaxID=756828 RepID=UPI0011A9313C|nr:hypothetical protein [Bacillus sp. WP8]
MIAEYMLGDGEKVIKSRVEEMSEGGGGRRCGVIGVCKCVGVDGYEDLKMWMGGELMDEDKQG